MKKIVLASHNQGKIKELREMLAPLAIEVVSAAELNLPEVEETGTTFVENATLKAKTLANLSGLPCLADDSGLCVNALGGRPGLFSARYAAGNYPAAFERLNAELAGKDDHSAYFICLIALCQPSGKTEIFEGRMNGVIADKPRGVGFGYDPIFIPDGYNCTVGELSSEEKNKISHRGNAMRKLLGFLSVQK